MPVTRALRPAIGDRLRLQRVPGGEGGCEVELSFGNEPRRTRRLRPRNRDAQVLDRALDVAKFRSADP
jgi:hypothetical protein